MAGTKVSRGYQALFPGEEFVEAKEIKSESGFMSHEPSQTIHHAGLRKLEDFSARMMASQMEGFFPDEETSIEADLARMAKLSVQAAKALLSALDEDEASG